MLKEVLSQIKISFLFLSVFSLLTGFIYPVFVTCIAELFFPWQANGSLLQDDNKTIGSILIGQSFDSPNYFWGRPSATTPFPYSGDNSSGSNMGPSNPDYLSTVKQRISNLHQNDLSNTQLVPVDLVTASGSGLDPDISPYAALYQVPRLAKANHVPKNEIENLIYKLIKCRTFYILGEPRVNVLELNLALKKLGHAHG